MKENEIYQIIKKNGYQFLEFKKLNALGVKNCFTLKPLNFSFNHQDPKKAIENFKTICYLKNFNYDKLCRPRQNHSNNVQIVNEIYGINHMLFYNTDALITKQKDVPLAITTADCQPIIIFDEKKKIICNIHSGWKGTLNTIILNATNILLNDFKCHIKDLLYFFGPSICAKCFEVDNDVYTLFKSKFASLDNINDIIKFLPDKNKYLIDTILLNETLLIKKGVKKENIYKCNLCTLENKDLMHSYRGRENKDFGLNVTIVSL